MRNEIKFISFLILLSFVLFFFYSIGNVLIPFTVSIIVAYLINPFAKKFEIIGFRRNWTVAIIVGLFSLLIIMACIKLVPILFGEIQQFIIDVPQYEQYVSNNILPKAAAYLNKIDPNIADNLKNQLSGFSRKFFEYIIFVISEIFNSSIALLNIIILTFLTPVIVFYLLRDWSKFVKTTNNLLPVLYRKNVMIIFKKIDRVLSAYIRGQISVCLIMSVFYCLALNLINLNNALLIGIIIGMLTIIPYLGVIIGFSICAIVALLQFTDLTHVVITIGIFIVGHLLESAFITPRLIGSKVGLHPVWIIFALMSGGALFGFWGVFFAIPVAAVIGVVFKDILRYYFSSSLYKHKKE